MSPDTERASSQAGWQGVGDPEEEEEGEGEENGLYFSAFLFYIFYIPSSQSLRPLFLSSELLWQQSISPKTAFL